MLKKYNYILLCLVLTMFILSCHNDVGEINPSTEKVTQITVPYGFDQVEGEIVGYIYNESNNPIQGAKVTLSDSETSTNQFGVFEFRDSKLDPQGTYLKVEKEGYLMGSDLVYPNSDGKGTSNVLMLEIKNDQSFEASEGGTIAIEGGGSISFGPSSFIRSSGSVYDGEVKGTVYRLSPSDLELGNKMPGGLLGFDLAGRHRVLSTFGMIAIELSSFDNQVLRLRSNKVGNLVFPIESQYQNLVEPNVPVWNFNTSEGIWKESMQSSNDGQDFYAVLNSLGNWNIAMPSRMSQVCGRLIYTNELPAKNYIVQIINNGLPSRIGITDQDGYFCGKVPFGENLKIQILHPICKEIIKEAFYGPFEEIGTIGDIRIETEEKYVSGFVECNGSGNGNSTIIIKNNNITSIFYPNTDGGYSINLEDVLCSSSGAFTIQAYDNSSESTSESFALTSEISGPLKLEVCDTECLGTVEIVYEKDDYCIDGAYDRAIVIVANGSDDYSYMWQDGSSDSSLGNPQPGEEICVTVKDEVTGCSYDLCSNVVQHERLGIESIGSSNTECQTNSGYITIEIEGGKGPFEYEWTGPEGYTSNEEQIDNLKPGLYTVVVKDGAACDITETIEVYDVEFTISGNVEKFCDLSIITIADVEGYNPFTYEWNAGEVLGNQLFVYTAGEYKVTMTDVNGCWRSAGFTISKATSLPEIDSATSCEDDIVTFSDVELGFDYYYKSFGSNDKVPVTIFQDDINISVLDAGYRFELGSDNLEFTDCNTSVSIDLPHFEGLAIDEVVNVSCEGCEDGSISYSFINDDCIDCTAGEVIIINRDNNENVTDLNTQEQLRKGEYYVVVLDDNSGCYIAHSLEIIE